MTLPPGLSEQSQTAPIASGGRLQLQPGTWWRAAVVAVLLVVLVAVVASVIGSDSPPPPLERYIRQGATQGPLALQQDLAAAFPPGSAPVPLLLRLSELGFNCLGGPTGWACNASLRGSGRSLRRVEVIITAEGLGTQQAVGQISTSLRLMTPP